jgi:DnaJ-class molecular chaperone
MTMARKTTQVTKLPNAGCIACGGMGSIRMTAHFVGADQEFESPCWECYGKQVVFNFPSPRKTDNA